MEIAFDIIYNVGILFIMMIPGVIMKRGHLCSDGFGKGISNLVLYVAQPCLIFRAYVKAFDMEILINALIVLLLSVIAHCIFLLALLVFNNTTEDRQRMLRFATIFSNAAFMGIPLIEAVLGSEYTIYASIYNITFNMFLWTLGVHICTNNNRLDNGVVLKSQASVKKALLHPVTIAAAFGLVYFFLPVGPEAMPELASECLTMVSNLVAPLSMLVLGLRIAEIDLHGFFNDINVYFFVILRHIALPAIVFGALGLLLLIGLPISYEIFMVTMILASAPAASSATMFAEKYDCDAVFVSKIVAFSTILSIVTMPLMALPVGLLY